MKSLLTSFLATLVLTAMTVFAPASEAQTGGSGIGICLPNPPVLVDFQNCPDCDIVFDFIYGSGFSGCEGCYIYAWTGMDCVPSSLSIPRRVVRLQGPCLSTSFFPIPCPTNPGVNAGFVELECTRCF